MTKITNEAADAIEDSFSKTTSKELHHEETMKVARKVAARHKDALKKLADNPVNHDKKVI